MSKPKKEIKETTKKATKKVAKEKTSKKDIRQEIKDELLIQELEESVKQDEINKMWEKYSPYILGCVAIIILTTGFFSFWSSYNMRANAYNTEIILTARDQADSATLLAAAVPGLKDDQRFLALFISAGKLLENKDYDEAVRHYKKIAADSSVSPVLRDLANLMVVRTEWSYGARKSDAGVYLGMLKPILSDPRNPWRYHAAIQSAMITAHDQKDYKKARQYLMPVLDEDNPSPSLVERARALDHIYYLRQNNLVADEEDAEGSTGGAESTKEDAEG